MYPNNWSISDSGMMYGYDATYNLEQVHVI